MPRLIPPSRSSSRRRLLKGGIIAGAALPFAPARWSAPVVNSVLLPAHAATSPAPVVCPPDPGTFTQTATCRAGDTGASRIFYYFVYAVEAPPAGCPYPIVTFTGNTGLTGHPSSFYLEFTSYYTGFIYVSLREAGTGGDLGDSNLSGNCSSTFTWSQHTLTGDIPIADPKFRVTVTLVDSSLEASITVALIP